jgi:hypothetical protein
VKKTDETKSLTLRRETLRELTNEDLRLVAGAPGPGAGSGGCAQFR